MPKGDVMSELEPTTLTKLIRLEKILGVTFKNKRLLLQAITHGSYKFQEDPVDATPSYSSFEYYGDAVMRYLLIKVLIKQDLATNLINVLSFKQDVLTNQFLEKMAHSLNLDEFIRTCSVNLDQSPKVRADVIEAIFGALEIDQGPEAALNLFERLFKDDIRKMVPTDEERLRTELYRIAKECNAKIAIETRQFDKHFETCVYINNCLLVMRRSRQPEPNLIRALKDSVNELRTRAIKFN